MIHSDAGKALGAAAMEQVLGLGLSDCRAHKLTHYATLAQHIRIIKATDRWVGKYLGAYTCQQ